MNREPANKGRKLPAEVLSDDEVRRLIGGCSRRAPTGIRNRALITLLYRGGLRIAEALDLRPKDVDLAAGVVRILEGKGRKARTVGLDQGACDVVALWLASRDQAGINGHNTLFCTLDGERLKEAYVRALLPRLARKAGIEKRVHAHGLRHTYAAQLRAEGVEVGVISRLLGHSNIATTVRYLDHVNPQTAIDAARQRKWEL
jgi:site-specific recombinase XerD